MSGSSPEAGPQQAAQAVVPAVLAATVLVVVLATWAAAIGPDRVFGGEGEAQDTSSEAPADAVFAEPENREDEEEERDDDRTWGSIALMGVEIALLIVLGYLLLVVFRRVRLRVPDARRRWRRKRVVEFEVLPATPDRAAEEIVRDADTQLGLLREGTPRNGIVACWHRFELQAEAAGIGREPWETSAEFTLRVLDLVSADERAVAELSTLYREARFSDHELNEPARQAASQALERLHRGLGARYAGGPS